MECALHVKLCDSVREGDRKIEPFRQLYRSARSLQSLILLLASTPLFMKVKWFVCVCVCRSPHSVGTGSQ